MLSIPTSLLGLAGLAFTIPVLAAPTAAPYKYVVAISVDGMHSSDVEKYVKARPKSTIASLLSTGYEYSDAYTSAVRESFSSTQSMED